jgi:hypothetical protein
MQLLAAMYPGTAIINPRRCRTSWNSVRRLGCTPVIFQDIPRSHGCVRMPRHLAALFFERVQIGMQVDGRRQHGQPGSRPKGHFQFLPTGSYVVGKR